MLEVVTASLMAYEARALAEAKDVGENVGESVGVSDSILLLLRADPSMTAASIASKLGKTSRTVERHLAELRRAGRVRREGSARKGRWVVVGSDPVGGRR